MSDRIRPGAPAPAQVLLVEDTPTLQMIYRSILERAGYQAICADTAEEGLSAFSALHPPVVLLDLMLPDRDGLDLMRDCLRLDGRARFIVITANGSLSKAVTAMRAGAFEFLVKPFDEARLLNAVANALRAADGEQRRTALRDGDVLAGLGGLIGRSRAMQSVYQRILSAGPTMAPVMLWGEGGTGLSLTAKAVHGASDRAQGPIVEICCDAHRDEDLATLLFGPAGPAGQEWGGARPLPARDPDQAEPALIGAEESIVARADGGTLCLHGIGAMSPACQKALGAFLHSGAVLRRGGMAGRPQKLDVRIITTLSRSPGEAVRLGMLDADLVERLRVVEIEMPPLRLRGNDVIEIAEARLRAMARAEGRAFARLSPEVADLFRSASWPGNVRQLVDVLRSALVLHDGPELTSAMIAANLPGDRAEGADREGALSGLQGLSLAEIERLVIEAAIARHEGSLPKAAAELGVAPSTLYRKREGWQADSRDESA